VRASAVRQGAQAAFETLRVAAYTVPTDAPESDGTAEWDSTTIVVVELRAGGKTGIGYTYAPAAAGKLVEEKLAEVVTDAMHLLLARPGRRWVPPCAIPVGPESGRRSHERQLAELSPTPTPSEW
jgi:hypothetical protein